MPKTSRIQQKLNSDFLTKATAPAIGYLLLSTCIYFFHFDIDVAYFNYVLGFTALSIGLRLALVRKVLNGSFNYEKGVKFISWLLFASSTGWAVVFATAFFDSEINSPDFICAIIMALAITNGSILTLGSRPRQALYFQNALLIPAEVAYYLAYRATGQSYALFSAVALVAFSLYMLKQTLDYNRQIKSKALAEIDLEESLQLLKESNEKIIIETTRAESASHLAALGQMAGGVAHEINSPLAAISIAAELITENIESENPDLNKLKPKLQNIIKSSKRISLIINTLKVISDTKQTGDQLEELSMAFLVQNCLNLCREKFEHANIKVNVSNKAEATVIGNASKTSQVIINLLNNAYDALKDFPLQNKTVTISFFEEDGFVNTCIENTGPLISDESRKKLFMPFFTTKDIGQGTGLGLSLCKSLIESQNGKIWFNAGKRNTGFTFSLKKTSADKKIAS
ncbi:MAG: sensor histidine kinase [Pseudobdellovibrio sp.]